MSATLIANAIGSIITDALSTWSNTANAFDGNTSQTEANSAAANGHGAAPAGTNFIGKDWGSLSIIVTQIDIYGPTNNSLFFGGATTGTLSLDGWNGSSWTSVDSFATNGANAQHITRTAVGSGAGSQSIVVTTPYTKHRISGTQGGSVGCAICEVQFYANGQVLVLSAAVGSYALTGVAAAMTRALRMTTAVGSYALTGVAATLHKNIKLVAAVGSYAVTGFPLILAVARAPASKFKNRLAKFVLQKLRINPPSLGD